MNLIMNRASVTSAFLDANKYCTTNLLTATILNSHKFGQEIIKESLYSVRNTLLQDWLANNKDTIRVVCG